MAFLAASVVCHLSIQIQPRLGASPLPGLATEHGCTYSLSFGLERRHSESHRRDDVHEDESSAWGRSRRPGQARPRHSAPDVGTEGATLRCAASITPASRAHHVAGDIHHMDTWTPFCGAGLAYARSWVANGWH